MMSIIANLRGSVDQEVFDYQVLSDVLRKFKKPRDRTRRLIEDNEIVRVKNGLYVFAAPFRRRPIVREYLANLIHGPSYVSLESALSFHGLIPERVEAVTSVALGRSHMYETPFGVFTYQGMIRERYALGATLETAGDIRFFIASPEKALADKVWTDKRFSGTTIRDFSAYLLEDLRINEISLLNLDPERLDEINQSYNSAKIGNLVRFLAKMRKTNHA